MAGVLFPAMVKIFLYYAMGTVGFLPVDKAAETLTSI
jgi:hypothetical protein